MEPLKKKIEVNISTSSIIKILVIILVLGFLYLIRDILAIVFISIVVAAALDPWIDSLQKRKIPRAVGILVIYLVIIGVVSLTVGLIVPPIVEQVKQITNSFPEYYEKLAQIYSSFQDFSNRYGVEGSVQNSLDSLSNALAQLGSGIFTASSRFLGGIVSLFAVLVIVFYMTVGEAGIKEFLHFVAPGKYQPYLVQKFNQIQNKLGLWLRGQIILSLIIFILTYIGLTILGIKYALVLALIAGLAEFIPFIGPLISAVPAVFLTFADSPIKALLVVILYIVIQQLENQIIVPKVMQKSVGLNPIVVIIVMLIGAKVAGILGVILAVPTATIIKIFLSDFFEGRKEKEEKLEMDS